MRIIQLTVLSIFISAIAFAQDVKFEIENAGLTVKGSFGIASNEISYLANAVSKSKFISVIAVSSINTGIKLRDSHLMKKDYFDQKQYPFIKFVSTEVKRTSEDHLQVKGELSIKNTKKMVTLDVLVKEEANGPRFIFRLPLNRLEFGVGGSSITLSDDVSVLVDVKDTK
jgi:polyisoprenoid-binding protein YceI